MRALPAMSWRAALALWAAAVVAALPFAYLAPSLPQWGGQSAGVAPVLGALALAVGVATLAGWAMGSRLGFGAPFVEAWLRGERPDVRPLARAGAQGAVLALAAVAVLLAMSNTEAPAGAEASVLPWWSGIAFALYGGAAEELMFRFGLMSGIAWVIAQLRPLVHSWKAAPDEAMAAWGGIVISAILFGLAHAGMGPGGLLVQASFRMAAGLLFGWLYWRQGIEAAIAAHLGYDLVVFYAVVALV